jgi:hypothetical protein
MTTMSSESAEETSPLLKKDHNKQNNRGNGVSVNNGAASGSATDNGDEEAQQRSESRNYEGLPEVQARLKYILPAVAIGVRVHQITTEYIQRPSLTQGARRFSSQQWTRPS